MIERKQPNQQTRLLVGNQQRKQVLLSFELRANISSRNRLAHGIQISLYISQNMRLGLDLQPVTSK
jgi:hypothetical protein